MKLLFSLLAACVAGLGLGFFVAWQHVHSPPWEGLPKQEDAAAPQAAPKAVVDQDVFGFGLMDSKATGSHDFIITNQGDAPLTLKAGATSCKCTLSKLEKTEIAPGESTTVTVEWHPKELVGRFQQSAKVVTNDPVRPELVLAVSGEVTMAVRAEPKSLIFSRIGMQETAQADVRLWCYLSGRTLKINDFKMMNESMASNFVVTSEPIPKSEVALEKNAQSGVLVHVTVKPGLPQGPFQQTILIATNLPEANHIEIPVQGSLSGDIVVAGADWDDDQNALYFGAIKRQDGASRRLLLIARGPHSADIKYKVVKVDPSYMQVTVGKTEQLGSGAAANISKTPVTVEVPANSPQESHLGSELGRSGTILLETTHPQVPQLKIRVRFAVEGGS